MFAGRITGLEAHYPSPDLPERTVLAEDRFQDLRMDRMIKHGIRGPRPGVVSDQEGTVE